MPNARHSRLLNSKFKKIIMPKMAKNVYIKFKLLRLSMYQNKQYRICHLVLETKRPELC